MALKSNTFIRRAEREDLDKIVEWMEEPDFLRFLYGDPTRSPRQIREHIVSMLGRSSAQTVPGSLYLLIDSEEWGPVGLLSLQNISWRNRSCCADLYIGRKELRNHMVAAISFYRAIDYCFNELNLHRVTAYIYAFNEPSWKIMEKTGAKRELTFREHVSRDGTLYDVYGYGLLREEYEAFCQKHGHLISGLMSSMVEARRASSSETSA